MHDINHRFPCQAQFSARGRRHSANTEEIRASSSLNFELCNDSGYLCALQGRERLHRQSEAVGSAGKRGKFAIVRHAQSSREEGGYHEEGLDDGVAPVACRFSWRWARSKATPLRIVSPCPQNNLRRFLLIRRTSPPNAGMSVSRGNVFGGQEGRGTYTVSFEQIESVLFRFSSGKLYAAAKLRRWRQRWSWWSTRTIGPTEHQIRTFQIKLADLKKMRWGRGRQDHDRMSRRFFRRTKKPGILHSRFFMAPTKR